MKRITRKATFRGSWSLLGLLGLSWLLLANSSSWKDSAQARVPRLDERSNLESAAALADGEWIPPEGFHQPPGMRVALAALSDGLVPGKDLVLPRALPLRYRTAQIVAWALTAACLLWGAQRRLWPLGSAYLFAFSSLAAMSVLRPLPEIWLLPFVAVHQLCLLSRSRGWLAQFCEAAAIGVASLFRGSLLILLVPSLWSRRSSPRHAGLMLLAALMPLTPFIVSQSMQFGSLAPPSTNTGINLYIGNGEGANGLFRSDRNYNFARDPLGREWLRSLGADAEGTALDVDRAWQRVALDWMAADPARTLRLYAAKFRMLLCWSELPQISSWDSWTGVIPALRIFVIPYGLLIALAMAALTGWRNQPRVRTLASLLLLLLLVHALFFVVGRFRVAMLPVSCVLAAEGIRAMAQRRRSAWIVAVVAALAIWPWGMGSLERSLRSGSLVEAGERHRLLAVHLGLEAVRGEQELQRAEERIEAAIAVNPTRAQSYRAWARVAYLRGGREAAMAILLRGIAAGADTRELSADLERLRDQP